MGSLILPSEGSVSLDTNVIIYSVEKIEPYWAILYPLWQAAHDGQFIIVSSELVVLETLVKPLKASDSMLEKAFRQILFTSKDVQLVPISLPVLEKSAHLRAMTGLKSPDAIHAATSLASGSMLFITNDPSFKRVSGLPVVVLEEILSPTDSSP